MQNRKKKAENGKTKKSLTDLIESINDLKEVLGLFTRDFLEKEYKASAASTSKLDYSDTYTQSLDDETLIELIARLQMVEYDTRDMSLNDCIEDFKLFILEQEHNLLCEKFIAMQEKLVRFLKKKNLLQDYIKAA